MCVCVCVCVCVCSLTLLNPDGFVFVQCVLSGSAAAVAPTIQFKPTQPAVIANYRTSNHSNVQASPGTWLHMQLPLGTGTSVI